MSEREGNERKTENDANINNSTEFIQSSYFVCVCVYFPRSILFAQRLEYIFSRYSYGQCAFVQFLRSIAHFCSWLWWRGVCQCKYRHLTIATIEFIIWLIYARQRSSNQDYIIVLLFWPIWCHSVCRSLHGDTPAQNAFRSLANSLRLLSSVTCFTVINTGYLYNISINDKFVGNYFMLVPLFCGHIVCFELFWVSVHKEFRVHLCSVRSVSVLCGTFWICSRWISMRWTILLNICIESSLRTTFTLHINGFIQPA